MRPINRYTVTADIRNIYIRDSMTADPHLVLATNYGACEQSKIQHRDDRQRDGPGRKRGQYRQRIVRSVSPQGRGFVDESIRDSFIQMISAAQGGTVINYSDRFSLSGMTGTFPPAIADAAKAITDTKGPPTQNNVAGGNGAASASSGSVAAYTAQTGVVRYAPMQGRPGTKITAKSASNLYPTSSVPIATTFLPPPTQTQTVTASNTFSTQSMENTVSA